MKRLYLPAVLTILISAAVSATGNPEMDTDGWMVFRQLDSFESVELRINADLTLEQGDDWIVKARGSDKDLDDLDVYVRGRKLVIRQESLFNFLGTGTLLEIYVMMPRLSSVELSSNGSVRTQGMFECRDLDLRLSGSGDMSIEAISDVLDAVSSGSGHLEYLGNANRLEYRGSGSGDAGFEVRANRSRMLMTGSGDLDLRGETDLLEIDLTGSGSIQGDRFDSRDAEVSITGSGNVDIRVSDRLKGRVTGTGSIRYYGTPGETDFRVTGTGSIRRN